MKTMTRKSKVWHVYIVRCADDTLYTGVAVDVAARVAQHSAGTGAKYTRARAPVTLVWSSRARSRSAACKREYAIKQLSRARKEQLVISSK